MKPQEGKHDTLSKKKEGDLSQDGKNEPPHGKNKSQDEKNREKGLAVCLGCAYIEKRVSCVFRLCVSLWGVVVLVAG